MVMALPAVAHVARVNGKQDRRLELVEIVGHALSTMLSNYLHHLSDVPIDYPAVAFASDDAVTA